MVLDISHVYVLYFCDSQKSKDSMELVDIFSTMAELKERIRKARVDGDIVYDSDLDIFRNVDEMNHILK